MNSDKDRYRTITVVTRAKLKRKKSKFIALAYPVQGEREAKEILAEIERKYRDASHVCWAYRIDATNNEIVERYDDAGEPAQSAGPPILNHIQGSDLLNVMVVVIRYFGGIKLGIGGLIRAYGDAAKLVLSQVELVVQMIKQQLKLRYPYSETGKVMNLINRYQAEVKNMEYSNPPTLTISINRSQIENLKTALMEATSGKVEFCSMEA